MIALTERHRSTIFHAVVVLGIAIGIGATLVQIVNRPPIELGKVRSSRDGGVSQVQVLATNESPRTTYCIEVRVGAFDRDGIDLQPEVVAHPRTGGGRLRPGQSVNFVAQLHGITHQEFEEKLDEFVPYVAERDAC